MDIMHPINPRHRFHRLDHPVIIQIPGGELEENRPASERTLAADMRITIAIIPERMGSAIV